MRYGVMSRKLVRYRELDDARFLQPQDIPPAFHQLKLTFPPKSRFEETCVHGRRSPDRSFLRTQVAEYFFIRVIKKDSTNIRRRVRTPPKTEKVAFN